MGKTKSLWMTLRSRVLLVFLKNDFYVMSSMGTRLWFTGQFTPEVMSMVNCDSSIAVRIIATIKSRWKGTVAAYVHFPSLNSM